METFRKPKLKGTKRLFMKLGTCSQTFFHILNREFGQHKEDEERATDPMAGGILQQGYQCGMLWGSSLALGAESYRRHGNTDKATAVAISATQHVMASFKKRTRSYDCYDITNTDFNSKNGIFKYMISGKAVSCFRLAGKWAPEAIQSAHEGLSDIPDDIPSPCKSCTSEVVKLMGASEEEAAMAAGLSGGIGLSGKACSALGAAIWIKTLEKCRKGDWKPQYPDPDAEGFLNKFLTATDYEFLCKDITGKKFNTIREHSDYISNGGCAELLEALSQI